MSREKLDTLRSDVANEMQRMQASVDAFDALAASVLGINRTDLRCLELLMQTEFATPGILGPALGLTTGSVTAMLDRLEQLGHLSRSADPADRRKVLVCITPAARAKTWGLYSPFASEGTRLLEPYTAEQLALLAGFLRESRLLYERELKRVQALPVPEKPVKKRRSRPAASKP
ncbi:DNA-binding transcriptional regulator, MarR family [Andreprevotia lacus DSM 23236]|jgi:DNA-binding MarR family transcriptional regulator|uniref:DNA-binding transcriptional regulator, MarR family n=1 Tax=Andreprevotia lacus DSM 23236 TaxID=1121001 RepID=A0A1W1XIS1_9NEIS|nr:MarR family transcriptional regulator [Andreprevotia lacus]SMC23880.1 DNA-binding transcriptional regulator, MarR family [Andreprevotia lacus DSM 23236]